MTPGGLDRIRARLRARRRQPAAEAEASTAPQPGSGEVQPQPGPVEGYERPEAEQLAAELEAIRQSESFRVGHAVVRALRAPLMLRRRPARRRSGGLLGRAIASLRPGEGAPEREPLPIPAGDRLLGPLNDGPSTTVFIVWGLDREGLRTVVAEVARLQLMLRDFKPLFVTDSDFWEPFSEHGYWFEYIPPYDEWARHNDATAWPDYVSERMRSIIASYRPRRVIAYEGGPVGELLRRGVLNSVIGRPRRPAEKAALRPPQR